MPDTDGYKTRVETLASVWRAYKFQSGDFVTRSGDFGDVWHEVEKVTFDSIIVYNWRKGARSYEIAPTEFLLMSFISNASRADEGIKRFNGCVHAQHGLIRRREDRFELDNAYAYLTRNAGDPIWPDENAYFLKKYGGRPPLANDWREMLNSLKTDECKIVRRAAEDAGFDLSDARRLLKTLAKKGWAEEKFIQIGKRLLRHYLLTREGLWMMTNDKLDSWEINPHAFKTR